MARAAQVARAAEVARAADPSLAQHVHCVLPRNWYVDGVSGESKTTRRVVLGTAASTIATSVCGGGGALEGTVSSSGGGNGQAGSQGGGASEGGATGSGTGGVGTGGVGGSSSSGMLICTETADNLLGPYYRENAPFRDDLTEVDTEGTPITVSGKVMNPDCEPLVALLDVWQADYEGDYDNDGVNDPPPEQYILRGRLNSAADGSFSFRTVIPGHYLNGSQFRPAHIHVRVSANGYDPLVTQLYFEGDPYNEIDPFIVDSLIMAVQDAPNREKASAFDFVLTPDRDR